MASLRFPENQYHFKFQAAHPSGLKAVALVLLLHPVAVQIFPLSSEPPTFLFLPLPFPQVTFKEKTKAINFQPENLHIYLCLLPLSSPFSYQNNRWNPSPGEAQPPLWILALATREITPPHSLFYAHNFYFGISQTDHSEPFKDHKFNLGCCDQQL